MIGKKMWEENYRRNTHLSFMHFYESKNNQKVVLSPKCQISAFFIQFAKMDLLRPKWAKDNNESNNEKEESFFVESFIRSTGMNLLLSLQTTANALFAVTNILWSGQASFFPDFESSAGACLRLKTPASPRALASCSISSSFCLRSSTSPASCSSLSLKPYVTTNIRISTSTW